MPLYSWMLMLGRRPGTHRKARSSRPSAPRRRHTMPLLFLERLESRCVPAASGSVIRSGFNSAALAGNDDGSTAAVSLGFGHSINYFGTSYSSVYINNNGNLTFSGPLGTFTPFGLTG